MDYLERHAPRVLVTLKDKEIVGSHQAAEWGQENWGGVTECVPLRLEGDRVKLSSRLLSVNGYGVVT